MSLNFRQRQAYQHTCSVYSFTRTLNTTTGKPGDDVYTLVTTGVKCLYQYTANVDDATPGVPRIKRMTVLTTDIVHFDAAEDIHDGWLLKNTTVGHPNIGEVHRILGAPRVIANAGRRKANKQSVMAMSMEKPPV